MSPTTFEIEGQTVTLPVEVRAATMAGAQWFVDADAAQTLVEATGLQVARNRRGRAVVSITSIAYADNDLGPYHEIAVAFVVDDPNPDPGRRLRPGEVTTYIHHLPVNQHFTCAAGRGIWGFPKWVADIDIVERRGRIDTTLFDDGVPALALSVPTGGLPVPTRELHLASYAAADGTRYRTPFTSRSVGLRVRAGRGVRLALGEGTVADELRSLELAERRPFLAMTCPRAASSFGAPVAC